MLDNIRLYDIAVLSQLYLESVKAGMYLKVQENLRQLEKELSAIFVRMSNQDLTEMTKRELMNLVRELRDVQSVIYGTIAQDIAADIEGFAAKLRGSLVVAFSEDEEAESKPDVLRESVDEVRAEDSGIVPIFGVAGILTSAALFKKIMDNQSPVSGLTIQGSVSQWSDDSAFFVESLVARARANGLTFHQLTQIVVGTPDPDLLSGISKRNAVQRVSATSQALVDTIVQQAGQDVIAAVASAYTKKYKWISILDSRTTDICRHRNGKIFEYGSGPRPPAHYRCRSTIAPIVNNVEYMPDLKEWLKNVDDRTLRIAREIADDDRFSLLTNAQESHILRKISNL